jgi:hypothetical protein
MEFIGLTLLQLDNLRIPIFSGFGTKARVSQADNKLFYKSRLETKLALDLQYTNARTQIENSIVSINNQKRKKLARSFNQYQQQLYSRFSFINGST